MAEKVAIRRLGLPACTQADFEKIKKHGKETRLIIKKADEVVTALVK